VTGALDGAGLLASVVRSGLAESFHLGTVAAVDFSGELVAWSGEIERPFWFRSSAKPFQAAVSVEHGARLAPEQLAVACGSHDGLPVHTALAGAILAGAGLDGSALQCPPGWPLDGAARARAYAAGYLEPRRIWHNCSGKHAAMLAACVAGAGPIETYLDPGHPLQRAMADSMALAADGEVGPVGVDGCGAPVFRGTVVMLARAYAALGADGRFDEVRRAMHRFPALTSGAGNADAAIAVNTNGVAKRGAEGIMAGAIGGRLGLAVKCWDGSGRAAAVGMLEALRQLGHLAIPFPDSLERHARPSVLGGGAPVGTVLPRLELHP
jgi:L-asparaginase II